jgi:hypothetical protein
LVVDAELPHDALRPELFLALGKLFLEASPPHVRIALGGEANPALPSSRGRGWEGSLMHNALEMKRWGLEFPAAFMSFCTPDMMAYHIVNDRPGFCLAVELPRASDSQ